MKKSLWRTALFLLMGAILGTLAGQLLADQVSFLSRTVTTEWHPQADLSVLRFSLDVVVRVNWLTLVGVIVAWFVARKVK